MMEAIFLKLVNMSLTASWLVLAVIALRILLKNAPKYIRVILWGFVGIRLIFPFSLESIFSLIPSSEPLPEEFLYAATPQVNTGIPALNEAINPLVAQSLTPNVVTSANPTQIWSFIFSQIWILGMVLMLIYALVSYLVVKHKVAASIKIGDNLRLCDHIESPFILGIFRPVIYLPSELDPKTADMVLAHEYAHLQRKDHWWKPLGFALLCVYWFNPILWLAYILLCRDIELACDEKVISQLGTVEKKAYSSALLHCSVNRRMIAACPLAFGEVGVKDRIKSVLHYKKPAFWVILVAVIICVIVAVCFLTDPVEKVDPMSLENWGITITAKDPSPTGVILEYQIPDNLDGEITIPMNQTLLKADGDNWVEVPALVFHDRYNWAKWLSEDQDETRQRLVWRQVYGILPPGQYSICKTLWLHQDGLSYQKDFYIDFIISSDESSHSRDGYTMTILESSHYSNGVSLALQVTFPADTLVQDKDVLYPQDICLTYATEKGTATANVYNLLSRTVDEECNTIVYHMLFSFTGHIPTETEFGLSIAGFSNTQSNVVFSTPISMIWQAEITDARIYEYKENDIHIHMTASPVVIRISATGTDFASIDELFDALTFLDRYGNRISTLDSYGGSQGGNLIILEIFPDTPIDVDSIESISIGTYPLIYQGIGKEEQAPSMDDVIASLRKKDSILQIDLSSGEDLILGSHSGWGTRNDTQYAGALQNYSYTSVTQTDFPANQNVITLKFGHNGKICYLKFADNSNSIKMVYDGYTEYYEAVTKYGDSTKIGTIMRKWYDTAEHEALQDAIPAIEGTEADYLRAAQRFCDAYYGTHLHVAEDSMFRYNFVRSDAEVDMEATNLARARGELDENGYAFWVTITFVPDSDRGAAEYMAGNTHEYTGSDPDIPQGALQYHMCGYIRMTEDGWVGEIVGTCW